MKKLPPPKESPPPGFVESIVTKRAAEQEAKRLWDEALFAADDAERKFRDLTGLRESSNERPKLTLRKPGEFLAMEFDDSDRILGDRLLATGQSLVIAAQGGAGKSRLLLQLAACITTARRFLAMTTGAHDLRWLILQTENSNRRLKEDLAHLKRWLGDDDFARFNELVTIHSIETDTDSLVSLSDPESVESIKRAIEEIQPDIIAIDPLNDFAIGDLNKDADMRLTLTTLSRICRAGNPNRAIVVLHHAITGKAGAQKATGFDRSSFARNSKTLHAWARGQMNLAPVDGDSNEALVVACGKCSNGKEFRPFAIRLNQGTLIFEQDDSVDLAQWEREVSSRSARKPIMKPDAVAKLCTEPMSRKTLVAAIMGESGCSRPSAYRIIERAVTAKKLKFNKGSKTYAP